VRWENYTSLPKQFRNQQVFDACGISGFISIDGTPVSGKRIIDMLCILNERENGLGAGFAAYGIYPKYKDYYALHFLLDNDEAKGRVLKYLEKNGSIIHSEPIPTETPPNINNPPIIWRAFFEPKTYEFITADEIIVSLVMNINENFEGAFVMSSGKNMGVFKGNGWSHEIANFYKIFEYEAFIWLGHSRFPTNTPGWWGGAHPFNLLNCSVVHNGEITSYGTNMRYLALNGYKCTLFADTEVIAYFFDLLCRKHHLPLPIATLALSPPLHEEIERMERKHQIALKSIRATYRSAMLNGPFSIVVGYTDPIPTLIGLTDRKKLRPLVCAISDDENIIYMSSEEASFKRLMLDKNKDFQFKEIWHPNAGTAVIARKGEGLIRNGMEKPFEKINLTVTGV
jgi:glutamate synthase domain-containing protein 1